MESNNKKRGRPKKTNGARCPDCARTETVRDGFRVAKGSTNGRCLWRCRNCKRQFIEGKVRRSKRLISANEAYARSVFVGAPAKQCRRRGDFFRYLVAFFDVGGKSGVTYRTIYRWYCKWELEQDKEEVDYPKKRSNASCAVRKRLFYEDLNVALSRAGAAIQAEYYRTLLETLKSGLEGDMEQAIYVALKKLNDSEIGKEFQAFFDIASKYSKFAYSKSDPMPHIRAFIPSELQQGTE